MYKKDLIDLRDMLVQEGFIHMTTNNEQFLKNKIHKLETEMMRLLDIEEAAKNLISAKGRHHSEQAMLALTLAVNKHE